MSRRLLAGLILVAGLVAASIALASCGSDGSGKYEVRAIFRNAFTIIPGEQVKSAGVPIGTIASLDVQDRKAAVVLDITDKAFQDFRQDAECQIRPQSLIGERFVECSLTQRRAPGQAEAPPLNKIDRGPGKGQYLLPDSNTVKPIDIDLVNNIFRLPYRQRLTIILNELGVGLAANGKSIRRAVRAANPTLRETEKVIAIFAAQNRTLAQIADDGDRVLAPLARERAHVAGAIQGISTTSQATAERDAALASGLQKLPATLSEVRLSMIALNKLADQFQPVAEDLKVSGKDLSRAVVGLGGLAEEGTPATKSFADTLEVGSDALVASKPILADAQVIAKDVQPIAANLSDLLQSLKVTGGMEGLLDLFYYTAAASNGYDEDGHYLRAQAILNECTPYTDVPAGGVCGANFQKQQASSSATRASVPVSTADNTPALVASKAVALPSALLPGGGKKRPSRSPVPIGLDKSKTDSTDGSAAVLDYLLGD